MCILLTVNLLGVVVFHTSMGNWRGISSLGICTFCYLWNLCGVAVFHTSMVNWTGYICPTYMCILLYVKLISCSSIPYINGQLDGGTYALSICAFCYMLYVFSVLVFYRSMDNWRGVIGICAFCYLWHLFGVVIFHTSMVDWRGVHLP